MIDRVETQSDESGETIDHAAALAAITEASKEQLILALRALFTAAAWKEQDQTLRDALHAAMHSGDVTPEEVYNALKNGA